MFKLFISIVVMTYSFINIAKADVSISGFVQHIVGMGDEVDGGVTDKFTRVSFGADTQQTTLDQVVHLHLVLKLLTVV